MLKFSVPADEMIFERAKQCIPEGWTIVRRGKVEYGDMAFSLSFKWKSDGFLRVGDDVKKYNCVIRKVGHNGN